MAEEKTNGAVRQNDGLQLTGEDLARILQSLKSENDQLKQQLQETTGLLVKMSVLQKVLDTREGVYSEEYVKKCAGLLAGYTDEFVKAQ